VKKQKGSPPLVPIAGKKDDDLLFERNMDAMAYLSRISSKHRVMEQYVDNPDFQEHEKRELIQLVRNTAPIVLGGDILLAFQLRYLQREHLIDAARQMQAVTGRKFTIKKVKRIADMGLHQMREHFDSGAKKARQKEHYDTARRQGRVIH